VKIGQLLKELDLKQRQFMNMLEEKETTESKNKLIRQQNNVKGKFGTALEVLVTMLKEAQNDAKDMNLKIRETDGEVDEVDRKIKVQQKDLQKLNAQFASVSSKLESVRRVYKEKHPGLKGEVEKEIEEDIKEMKLIQRSREQKKMDCLIQLQMSEEEIDAQDIDLIKKEARHAGYTKDSVVHHTGNIFEIKGRICEVRRRSEGAGWVARFRRDGETITVPLRAFFNIE